MVKQLLVLNNDELDLKDFVSFVIYNGGHLFNIDFSDWIDDLI